jgi:WD40 repeat protein
LAAVASRRSNRIAAVNRQDQITVWEETSGKEIFTVRSPSHPVSIALSPDGRYLAASGHNQLLQVWDTLSRKDMRTPPVPVVAGGLGQAGSVAFSEDGTLAALGTSPPLVWEVQTGLQVDRFFGDGTLSTGTVVFSSDGNRLAETSQRDGLVQVWDLKSGKTVRGPRPDNRVIGGVVFSPDGQQLAVLRGSEVTLERLYPKEALPGHILHSPAGKRARTLAFDPAGRLLAARAESGEILLWDVQDVNAVTSLPALPSPAGASREGNLAFRPGARVLVSAMAGDGLAVWDLVNGGEKRNPRFAAGKVRLCAFSPDGSDLATADGSNQIVLWNPDSGERRKALAVGASEVRALAFQPGRSALAAGGSDPIVKLWDASTGGMVRDFRGHTRVVTCLAFSLPDGKQLAAGSADETVCVWDTASSRSLFTLIGHSGLVTAVAYSPNGKRLATCGHDGTVKLWDTALGQSILTLQHPEGPVASVAFGPNGHLLASCSQDGTVRLWDGRPASP